MTDGTVVLDFYATWCGPCAAMSAAFDTASEALAGTATFRKVDIDVEEALCTRFRIRAVPTLLVLHGGEVVDRVEGLEPEELPDWLAAALSLVAVMRGAAAGEAEGKGAGSEQKNSAAADATDKDDGGEADAAP